MINAKELPVYQERQKIIDSLKDNQVIIVESPTGSGKTTQIPIILHEAGYTHHGVIGVTQPRRIAAVSVCDYIAGQLNSKVPGEVGYKMRFEDQTLPETKMKIMTDGTLLQEIKTDPLLTKYSVLMIDEAHERSLNIDFILGLLKQILVQRPDLKVIISSATLNTKIFQDYFNSAPIVFIETPVFPVQVIYDSPAVLGDDEALIEKISEVVERAVKSRDNKGDILIFLGGEKQIKDCCQRLSVGGVRRKLHLQPLYGRLSKEEQEQVFVKTPIGKTKVVVSTNIAETSITIDGITTVIDSGICKMNFYNPQTFTSTLRETSISQASANQRKGRAGRTQSGTCYRLYSPSDFENKPAFTPEEIYRTDLAEVVLRMAELGIRDFFSFDFISSPGNKGIKGAIETLLDLDAIDNDNSVTSIGKLMLKFPLMPRHSRMIVEAINKYPNVIHETVIAASFLSTNNPFLLPPGEEMEARKAHHHFKNENGDFVSYVKIFNSFIAAKKKNEYCQRYYMDEKILTEIVNITSQLEEIVSAQGIPISSGGSIDDYLCAVGRGLIQFICARSKRGLFYSRTTDRIIIHPGSVMFKENPPFLIAGEIVRTSRMYARSVSPLRKDLINRIKPGILDDFAKSGKKKKDDFRADTKLVKNKDRDTTNFITVGDSRFPVIAGKKRKAELEWKKLYMALSKIDAEDIPNYNNMRGSLYLNGVPVVPDGRVNMLFRIVLTLNPKKDYVNGLPKKNWDSSNLDHILEIAEWTENLLFLVMPGKRKKKSFGFVSLQCDGRGFYWLKSHTSFNAALSDSLESLERLVDDWPENVDEEIQAKVSQSFRKLNKAYTY